MTGWADSAKEDLCKCLNLIGDKKTFGQWYIGVEPGPIESLSPNFMFNDI